MSISAAQRTRLGVFIVASLVITVMIFAAGIGLRLSQKTATYYSEFRGESLSGLSKGMDVKYYGVQVGKVKDIKFNPDDMQAVVVEFEIDETFPVKDDMEVHTGMLGITGLKYIEMSGGAPGAGIILPGGNIKSKKSLMASLEKDFVKIITNIDETLTKINAALNEETLDQIGSIVSNVDSITGTLNKKFNDYTPEIDTMFSRLNSTLATIDNEVLNFSESGSLEKIITDVDSTIVSIRSLSENFNLTFVQSREDLSATMLDLRETMENLNNLSQILLENPSLILRGSPQQKRKIK